MYKLIACVSKTPTLRSPEQPTSYSYRNRVELATVVIGLGRLPWKVEVGLIPMGNWPIEACVLASH
jgi:hypothetical protein